MIKEAKPCDIPSILEIMKEYGDYDQDYLLNCLNNKERYIILAYSQKDILKGFILTEFNKEAQSAIILELFVEKSSRKKGIARLLKKEIEKVCVSKGIRRIKSLVNPLNKTIQNINQSLGYQKQKELIMYSKEI